MQVVIIDDVEINVALMRGLAARLDDVQAVGFTDARAGLEHCIAHAPDLVVTDYMMPELDGIQATTHHLGIAGLKQLAPKCQVVEGQRFVDSGKIITTAGVTAGIDGALHVVERLLGEPAARWTAREWMEHPR